MSNVQFKTPEEVAAEKLQNWREGASVSIFQANQALDDKGYMGQVEEIMNDPETPRKVKRAWNLAQNYRRMSENVISMAATLGISDEELDDLFVYAATLEA